MLGQRLMVALMVLMLLVGCGSNPTRDDSGPSPQGTQTSAAGPDGDAVSTASNPNTSHGGGGSCCGSFNGDPRALLVIVGIIVVLGVAFLVIDSIDHIRDHWNADAAGSVKDGVYHATGGVFSVAVPDGYSAHGHTGVKGREPTDLSQEQVAFLPVVEGDPLYGVSVQTKLPAEAAAMPLEDYATKLYPSPGATDPTLQGKTPPPVLEERLTLDGKPALFREYAQAAGAWGKPPVHYLLYFIKTGTRGALVSITWTKDCPKCGTGPETDIRAMDPQLKRFVESFHLADAPPAQAVMP